MIFENNETTTSHFSIAGFGFSKVVTHKGDRIHLKIFFRYNQQCLIDRVFTDLDDWVFQADDIRRTSNQYIIDYIPETDRLYAHLTSNEMNHELTD